MTFIEVNVRMAQGRKGETGGGRENVRLRGRRGVMRDDLGDVVGGRGEVNIV